MPAFCLRFLIVALFALLVAACGKPDDKSLCDAVSCDDGGVCNAETGTCVNPATCSDNVSCVEGYECIDGDCVVEFACGDDGSCDRGTCDDGACVNPDRCDADNDCVPGFACDGDACIEDLCDTVSCERGVCEKETGECVNAAVCTAATQGDDCLDGYTCYDQSCADEATICADLDCDRGQCSYLDLACINGEDCAGDDLNCLEGFFCNAVNQCQQNVCDGTDCPRGVCEQASGSCVNADSCSSASDCIDGFFCVDGACTDQMTACEICPGNQVCSYDEPSTSVVCDEAPGGCLTSIDCVGSRECDASVCGDPVPCVPDALEPNNSQGAATNWFDVNGGLVNGTICSGDSDFFSFDTADDPQFTGTLIALLTLPQSDIGVGTLALELLDDGGQVVASVTSQPTDEFIRLEYDIGNINQGVYTLSIADDSVGSGGIAYNLFMDLTPDATVAICQNAATLTGMQTGDTNTASNELGSNCVSNPAATEEAWLLEVTERSFVQIDVQSAEFDAVISLRRQCESDQSELDCSNSTTGTGTESLGARLTPGSYSVVVQGVDPSQNGAYTINVTSQPVLCTPMDNTCVDMTTASVCNAQGTGFDMVTCDSGCDMAIGGCAREVTDVCTTAIDATQGYTGQIGLGLLQNDYDPGSNSCVPSGTFSATDGPDGVFSVTLQPNEVLFATATQVDFDDISMYLVDDCGDVANNCVDGVNVGGAFEDFEELIYTNASALPQDLFLIVDSETGSLGGVDMDIVVGASICTPGMTQCNGAALETCNQAGIGFDSRTCSFGCDAGTGACIPPPNEMCGAGAIDVSGGGTFMGSFDDYANDYSDTSDCTGFSANGPDAVYQITGNIGDIVNVSLAGSFDGSLYAVTDCSDISNTCLDGSDNGQPEEIQFVLLDTNPVYIVADAFGSSTTADYTLDVTIQSPDCTTYDEAIMCQPDGTTLQYCNSVGLFEDYACATTCTGAACDAPTGDRCFDIPIVSSGDTLAGVYSDFTNAVDPGTGTCINGSGLSQPGPDAIYQIDLIAGDLLTADMTSSVFGASMYVMTDCADARGSCVWAAPREDQLQFFASASGTYFFVIDSTSAFSTGAFSVDIDVQAGFVCQPGGATCDQQTDTLTVCNIDGTNIENTIVCPNGCANGEACAAPTVANDTCTDAEVISGSVRYLDSWDRFTNALDPGQTMMNSCDISSFQSDGPDAIYAVSLGAGEVVDVTVDDLGAVDSPALYIATDCNDTENTCVGFESVSPAARVGYVSQLGETVYVIVDNTGATNDDPFIVDFDIRPSECAPNLNACRDASTREFCDSFGILQTEDCFFGCTNGACNPPTNDLCATPEDISVGGTVTIPWTGYNNDYGSSSLACTGFSANGPDAVYEVTAAANDILVARLSGDGADTSLWVTTTCGDPTACVIGDDTAGTGNIDEIVYVVPADGTYYIMADSFSSSPSGSFTLEVILSPPICTPGTAACDLAGQNVEVCNDIGNGVEVFTCDVAGCVTATNTCATETGEHPAAAIDANALGQFTGLYSDFADDFNLASTGSCTGWQSPGADAAYFVDLTMGQTLTATLNSTDDTSLYMMNTIANPDTNCLVGDDVFGSGESINYTATADERIYVIVDAFTANAASMFTLDLSVQ